MKYISPQYWDNVDALIREFDLELVGGAEYSKQKGFSDEFCCNLIIKALGEHNSLPRTKINELILEYLPKDKGEKLNKYKVGNLLSKMKRQRKIDLNEDGEWILVK